MQVTPKHVRSFQFVVALFSLLLLAIVGVTFYEVVARYIFKSPTIWANELALWLSAILFLAAGLYAMQRDQHLRITVLYDVSPPWLQRILDLVTLACCLIFCFGIAWFGAPSSWQSLVNWEPFGTAWNPPIPATVKPAIVVTTALMGVYAIINCVKKFQGIPSETAEESAEENRVD
ncbi:TRAP transporter small permease [uncultured Thalassospira sp.]|jgi:TRAP-type C4-dicarboxylate transport system permease small subunit|uniref:TRAP transporter small permease subunit n=1 Tax=uncultured Thalassospira sp. TaxID=404382 RepID=UPI0030D9FB8C|tara:strand:+ start:2416 stop:2943 length:528 start_codon:yes stop_codon:yes gene_type:complete